MKTKAMKSSKATNLRTIRAAARRACGALRVAIDRAEVSAAHDPELAAVDLWFGLNSVARELKLLRRVDEAY